MSEKMTRIRLPGQSDFSGLMEWGDVGVDKMISAVREHAKRLRLEAEAIDAALDADFQVDLVRGPYVQHHIRALQTSARIPPHVPSSQRS